MQKNTSTIMYSLCIPFKIVLDLVSLRGDLCLQSIDLIQMDGHNALIQCCGPIVQTAGGYPDFNLYYCRWKRSHSVSLFTLQKLALFGLCSLFDIHIYPDA